MFYSQPDNPKFDNDWKQHVEKRVRYVMWTFEASSIASVLLEDFYVAINDYTTGKAAGYDTMCYEHLLLVEDIILPS
ncbi:hypothetical protein DPMN_157065 [Dreissena polymorpha]|uniref:Uncharacterized protein n=1 Tax=Dreissena polymorpha TaxID=45954 RepID=A0A9D4EJM4_DREPO|nr:hypothetical protein DPMN_157065 [Dreissena polymorpha]